MSSTKVNSRVLAPYSHSAVRVPFWLVYSGPMS